MRVCVETKFVVPGAFLLAMALGGCQGQSASLVPDEQVSDERSRRMDITVVSVPGGTRSTLRLSQAHDLVRTHCESQRDATSTVCSSGTDKECQLSLCDAELWLCVAQTLLLMGESPADVELNSAPGTVAYRVDDHDAESQAALAHSAQIAVARSMRASADGLAGPSCTDSIQRSNIQTGWNVDPNDEHAVGDNSDPPQQPMERFSSTLAEALRVGERAADFATERTLSVAARDAADIDDLGRAARLTWFDTNLSRVLAAQVQVGGTAYGTVAMPTDWHLRAGVYEDDALRSLGIGALPRCGEGCTRALDTLRRSGASYGDLVPVPSGPASASQLTVAMPTIVEHLNDRISAGATIYGTASTTPEEFAAILDVTLGDLLQAVEQMRYEDVLYSRPRGVTLVNPVRLAPDASGQRLVTMGWDPTTLSAPVPPPAMHYLTRARLDEIWTGGETFVTDRSLRLPVLRPERAYLFAFANAVAAEALADPTAVPADARVPLVSIVQQARERRALDIEVCASTTSDVRIRVFGAAAPASSMPEDSEFRLVEGSDALRCAVHGSLVGQPCTDTTILLQPAAGWTNVKAMTPPDPRQSRLNAVEFTRSLVGETYIVRLRPGATGGPGAYEAVAGLSKKDIVAGTCTTLAYDSISHSAAARIFEFSDDGRTPSRDCAGAPRRLPLEDEIIDDGDGYEDSWQHHLRTASAAALHADQLGQDLISSGLQMDTESERQVEAIQNLCGVHINVDIFAEDQIDADSCDESMGVGCADGYTCVGDACISEDVFGTAGSSQREALEDCLGLGGGGEIIPVVGIGTEALCAWRRIGTDQLCGGTEAACPTVKPTGVCSLPAALSPMEYEVVTISNNEGDTNHTGRIVGLVGSIDENGERVPGTVVGSATCSPWTLASIRALRSPGLSSDQIEALIDQIRLDGFFEYENVRRVAGKIGWSGEPFNYSHLTVDGSPLRDDAGTTIGTTGDAESGSPAVGAWPCIQTDMTEPGPHSATGSDLGPLTGTEGRWIDCGVVDDRVRMNWRLGRAAAVLTAFTDLGLSNHQMPVFYADSNDANLADETVHTALLDGVYFDGATSVTTHGETLSGHVYGPHDGTSIATEVWRASNGIRLFYGAVGTNYTTDISGLFHRVSTNTQRPIAFVDLGYEIAASESLADRIARRLWEGLGRADGDAGDFNQGFWHPVPLDSSDIPRAMSERRRQAAKGRLFLRALRRNTDAWSAPYLNHGRNEAGGGTDVNYLTHLFGARAYNLDSRANWVHLFPSSDYAFETEPGYGDEITRRDLLDAMEVACYVSSLSPPPPDMVTDEDRPEVRSADDTRQVQHFAERVAQSFDAMARTQVVRDLPRDVVDRLTSENVGNLTSEGASSTDRVTGHYGALMSELRVEMRSLGQAPGRMASTVRTLSSEMEIFERRSAIFERELQKQWLGLVVDMLYSAAACLSAVGSASTWASGLAAAGVCGIHVVIASMKTAMTQMTVATLADEHAIELTRWADNVGALIDSLDADRTVFLNAIDRVQTLSGQLRDQRTGGRAALAEALFLSSDAAGRQYRTNTVMRRMYDINLQRYQSALTAARRSGAIARYAIEQRFGVDLEQQQCAQAVDAPSTWAADICTATGIDYRELRDPDVDLDETAIRQMYIGDYVRRLEQYVESYRFDFPYQDGDDLMVMSLRDDVVRATSTCVAPVSNWLGSSNDLLAANLPNPDGSAGVELGWMQRGCKDEPPYQNCMAVEQSVGPRFALPTGSMALPAPVHARSESQPPRGFEVEFAPRTGGNYVGDYQDGAAYTQALILPAGLYRLSWYERRSGTGGPAVDMRPLSGSLTATAPTAYEPRNLDDTWRRFFKVVDIPTSRANEEFHIGVFAEATGTTAVQRLRVAGLQLERVNGTATEIAYRSDGAAGVERVEHGPELFAATTSPGYGYVDDCVEGSPDAFRNRWMYDCAQLCSGGFSGHCDPGERPTQFCYWELPFNLDEDRLLSRGGDFGGGFAFGNYNYRSGDIAVNVVGTGVRDCEGTNATACYATAGIPFSLMHTAPAASTLEGGSYSIRAHDGSLHPVDLFDGRIESARALAAERYLSNPLSSADAALINDYTRGELRGRPMTGNYRILIWDNGDVNFDAIEDVQILWRYRYFTRTGSAYVCE
ncbi:MAG: hypothetical protein RLP09_22830 [Sandaracinaceae bacterium]